MEQTKSIFDIVIPIGIFIFFFFIIGGAFLEPLKKFWNWLTGLFDSDSPTKSGPSDGPFQIVYER